MLKKMLKHDLKHVLMPWIITTAIFLMASVLGAISIRINILYGSKGLTIFGIMLFVVSSIAYAVLGFGISIYRCYQSCFTDEAYLTFTLPVKRNTVLISKLLSMAIPLLASLTVMAIVYHPVFAVTPSTNKDYEGMSKLQAFYMQVAESMNKGFEANGWLTVIIIIEVVIIAIMILFGIILNIFDILRQGHKEKSRPKRRTLTYIAVAFLFTPVLLIVALYTFIFIFSYSEAIIAAKTVTPREESVIRTLVLLIAICVVSILNTIVYRKNLRYISEKLNLA